MRHVAKHVAMQVLHASMMRRALLLLPAASPASATHSRRQWDERTCSDTQDSLSIARIVQHELSFQHAPSVTSGVFSA